MMKLIKNKATKIANPRLPLAPEIIFRGDGWPSKDFKNKDGNNEKPTD